MKKLLKFSLLLGISWVFVGCVSAAPLVFQGLNLGASLTSLGAPNFSENSPLYYDKEIKLKQGACALRFNTKLDLSRLTQQEKEMYWSRFGMIDNTYYIYHWSKLGAGNPDFCYKGKVVQVSVTSTLREVYFNIPCSCVGQMLHLQETKQ